MDVILRTFTLIVFAHPCCAKSHEHPSWRFNGLGRLLSPIFLTDHFLYRFSTFSEKMKKIYRLLRSLNFLQNVASNSVLLSSLLSVWRFQMLLEGLSFVKTLAKFNLIGISLSPLINR